MVAERMNPPAPASAVDRHPEHGPWQDGPDGVYCGACLLLRWTIEKVHADCAPFARRWEPLS